MDSFAYETCALEGECDKGTVFIDVGSSVGPTAVDATVTTPKNTPIDIDLSDDIFDPNDSKDVGFCTLVSDASNGDVDSDGSCDFTYTPDPGFVGRDEFTYKVCDEDGNCDTGIVTIIVTDNNGPNAPDKVVTTPADTPIDIDGGAGVTDPDNNVLLGSCRVTSNPSFGAVDNNGSCVFTYLPQQSFIGTDQFTYEICDADGNCDSATITIIVSPSRNPPVAEDDSVTTTRNVDIDINVAANDSDPDDNLNPDSCTVTSSPSSGTATNNGNCIFTYAPNNNFVGTDIFTYDICDTDGLCDTATVTIVVALGNVRPNAEDDSAETPKDTPVDIDVADNDSDPNNNLDDRSCTALSNVSNGSISNDGRCTFTYTPAPGFVGTDEFTYEICDTEDLCDTATVRITVTPVNDPPVASDDAVTTTRNIPIDISVAANDYDPDDNLLFGG